MEKPVPTISNGLAEVFSGDLGRNGSYLLLTGLVGDDNEPLAKFLGSRALIVGTGGSVSGLLGRFIEGEAQRLKTAKIQT